MKRQSEHSLQIAVAHMLTLVLEPSKTWWSAIDHGVGRLSPAEAGIRKRRGVKPGLPDVIVLAQGAQKVALLIGIELKAQKGALSPAQKEVRDAWLAMGHAYYVARSLEEVQEILEHCRVPMRRRMNFLGASNVQQPVVRPAATGNRRAPRRGGSTSTLPVVQ